MKIAFLSSYDPDDNNSWSGTPKRMIDALRQKFSNVYVVGPYKSKVKLLLKILSNVIFRLTGYKYDYNHSYIVALEYKFFFEKALKKIDADIIFCAAGSTEISLVKSNIPIIYTSDVTYALINDYYKDFSNVFGFSKKEANYIEKLALKNASIITYPSNWALESAKIFYNINIDKLRFVPWGANFDYVEKNIIRNGIDIKSKITFLFIGVDWIRKGGSIVFEALSILRDKYNLDIELVICGCVIPEYVRNSCWVKNVRRLNKNNPQELKFINDLYRNSDFLFVPSRSECYGMVFCEASAYALPIIATNTGGISSVVDNGGNGVLLPLSANSNDYAEMIYSIIIDTEKYKQFSLSSRQRYVDILNWNAWGDEMRNICCGVKNYD